ncbi:hypothetical protein CR983_03055 [Candidatus Saccharibacteria bacterium]|nr:MAG: hypothetical protein CR983_03055 [Candidatus Saccharibacteria bacterium]
MSAGVLIVDDDHWYAASMERELVRASYDVRCVGDVVAALDAMDDIQPDAVVLDLLLPGANGLALLHELRSHADWATVPVVVVTTLDSVSEDLLRPYGVVKLHRKQTMHPCDIVETIGAVA